MLNSAKERQPNVQAEQDVMHIRQANGDDQTHGHSADLPRSRRPLSETTGTDLHRPVPASRLHLGFNVCCGLEASRAVNGELHVCVRRR